jgi:hypothetical protein
MVQVLLSFPLHEMREAKYQIFLSQGTEATQADELT